jgi:hypothetical protein
MKPTEAQKKWLASVTGPDIWRELLAHESFRAALESSIERSHEIALRYSASKERVVPFPTDNRLWAA